ncbi:MAG: DnaJ domain-containing protein, partial [Psychroserpens sp.]|nr:DnaJ domain-containing protein [Psychroserpens sp.]
MQLPNYYGILKIDRSADLEAIKKAFRREIAFYHPDNNKSKNAREQFDLIVEAFDVLSNPEKRKSFDDWLDRTSQRELVIVEDPG